MVQIIQDKWQSANVQINQIEMMILQKMDILHFVNSIRIKLASIQEQKNLLTKKIAILKL